MDALPNGTLYADWADGAGKGFSRSWDGGVHWSPRAAIGTGGFTGPVIHDPWGVLYVPIFDRGAAREAVVAILRSTDHGNAWVESIASPISSGDTVAFAANIFPVAAVDEAGTIYLVWSTSRQDLPVYTPKPATEQAVYFTASLDHGATWSSPRILSEPGHSAIFPWIAAGAPGRVAVSWYENMHGVPEGYVPDTWNAKLVESVTADAATPVFEGGYVQADPIHVGTVCVDGTECVANDRSLGDFFSLIIGDDGQPVVAYAADYLLITRYQISVYTVRTQTGTPLR
jgi:hypothetical protein